VTGGVLLIFGELRLQLLVEGSGGDQLHADVVVLLRLFVQELLAFGNGLVLHFECGILKIGMIIEIGKGIVGIWMLAAFGRARNAEGQVCRREEGRKDEWTWVNRTENNRFCLE
jgi:hypothetical protein